jgi:uroporphyrinogen decarboxylase
MTPREVVLAAIRFENPPYVPWDVGFTVKPAEKLARHFGSKELQPFIKNHVVELKSPTRDFHEEAPGMFRDAYGVLWDRTIDRDIGTPCEYPLRGPTLKGYSFPSLRPREDRYRELMASLPGLAVRFSIGFSLFERAWTLRGMENLLMDFMERPSFVHELLDAICEHNLQLIEWGLQLSPDIVYFGDDWGQQRGLIMGPRLWREFIKPRIKRMYGAVRAAGKIVSIHSCGDVDELFDDLVELGLNLFNPFQPEAMDVYALKKKYHGRLAFHGGLSTQRVLPFGTPDEVRAETRRLIREIGRGGGYIFAPAHAVPGDVPLENLLAFIEVLQGQPGFREMTWPS